MGCTRAVMDGRDGWAKVLPARGWKKHCVRFSLDLTNSAASAAESN